MRNNPALTVVAETINWYKEQPIGRFSDLELSHHILNALYDAGYVNASGPREHAYYVTQTPSEWVKQLT